MNYTIDIKMDNFRWIIYKFDFFFSYQIEWLLYSIIMEYLITILASVCLENKSIWLDFYWNIKNCFFFALAPPPFIRVQISYIISKLYKSIFLR